MLVFDRQVAALVPHGVSPAVANRARVGSRWALGNDAGGTFGRAEPSKTLMARTIITMLAAFLAVVAVAVWLLVSSFPDNSDTGYRVTMRPSRPLSHAACKAEEWRDDTDGSLLVIVKGPSLTAADCATIANGL
jgi:hypothetical protein